MSIEPPVIGWQLQSGQLEGVSEEGVATAPIISIAFIRIGDNPDDAQPYLLSTGMVPELTKALTEASDHSVAQWHPRWRQEDEERNRKRRRDNRIAACLFAVIAVSLCTLSGITEAQSYRHHGGAVEGVLGAVDQLWRLLGIVMLWLLTRIAAGRFYEWRKGRRAEKARPAETPLDDRL